jgi:hypothetical protein
MRGPHCIIRSVDAGLAVAARALDEAARVLDAETLGALRAPASRSSATLEARPGGALVGFAGRAPTRRRVVEIDRGGTLAAVLRWRDDALAEASVRIPDGRWVTIEPRATREPWGPGDRLWLGAGPGRDGAEALVSFAAVDYAAVGAIPALADPSRLPHGAGTAVLNLLAALAADQQRGALRYEGPYPTEQLFLALLESFRYVPTDDADPLAAFLRGDLAWRPAPHERSVETGGLVIQRRDRVEKVVWEGRTYYRPDWQTVARHAPRRVRESDDGVVCSLWALGAAVEDHLRLTADGRLVEIIAPAPAPGPPRALPDAIARGIVASVAATCVPALAPFVRAVAHDLAVAWAPVDRDLLRVTGPSVQVSTRLRGVAVARVREAPDRAAEVALAFALLAEIAALAGDTLRMRAQAALAAHPEAEQAAALAVEEDPGRGQVAAVLGRAVEALLADLTIG